MHKRRLRFTIATFILAAVTLAFAATTLVGAPTLLIWTISIAATEYGHLFALAAGFLGLVVLFVAPLPLRNVPRILASWIFFISAGLLISPAIESGSAAKQLSRWVETPHFSFREAFFPTREEPVPFKRIEFQRPDQSPGLIYFYPAQVPAGTAAPVVIVVHGGSWKSGDPLQLPELNSVLARRGYAVASVDYRLLPEAKWPTQKNDVLAAIQYLRDHATDYAIDPSRLVLLGRSAGGQIAETVALDPPEELKLAIVGCIAFYSPADMSFAYQFGREDDLASTRPLLREYLGGTPESSPKTYREASGYDFVDPTSPPVLLMHGRHDNLVWFKQSLRLTEEIQKIRGTVYFLDLPWATHGFDYNIHGPSGQLSTQAVLGFLKKVF